MNTFTDDLTSGFVPALSSLEERRPRTLKHGDTFAVFDHNGDAYAWPGSPEGIYHRDTRHLSTLTLGIGGMRPMLLSSTLRGDNATLTCDLTNPDLTDGGGHILVEHDLIHVRRIRFIWDATCYERIAVRNFDVIAREITLSLKFAADFSDVFEVRGTQRARRGTIHPPQIAPAHVLLSYSGLDQKSRETRLCFDPEPATLEAGEAVFQLALEPQQIRTVYLRIDCEPGELTSAGSAQFFAAYRKARRALRQAASRAASVASSNEIFDESTRRNVSDLYTLITDTEDGPYPYAGIPWFSTMFGRDALITALQTLWLDPEIARGVLANLAARQATAHDPAADAQPGKILHEMRRGEMAELGEVPFRCYYGSVDATPLFIVLAGAYLDRTGDLATIRRLWPSIEAALSWIETYGDPDGDGFVEYLRETDIGLANQGWKDSHDSVFHADGRLAEGPIALCEVQAYVYGAYRAAERMAGRLGLEDTGDLYGERAEALRTAFDAAFFDEELQNYVLALDGAKRPCRVHASNAGHALMTGIAFPHRADAIANALMDGRFFSGWGVRTLAEGEPRYNPMSYHNGSVWPHDNAIIAAGLARYGHRTAAMRIFEGIFAASVHMDLRRLPELFCGFLRKPRSGPVSYPVACTPQAWATATPLSLLQSCLGLDFRPDERLVIFDHPILPAFLEEVVLRRLSIDHGRLDVALRRSGSEVAITVLHREGDIRVSTLH